VSRRHARSALVLVAILGACGRGSEPVPQPGQNRGITPDLRGRRVIVLPVQIVAGVEGDPSAELAFALTGRSDEVDWVLEPEILEILERSPAMQTSTRGLPVSLFLQAEVDRVGDPLYGQLRRMSALVNAEAVLLPIRASFEANAQIEGSTPRVRLVATLIEPRDGRVMWYGVEEGDDFPRGDPRGLASAAERMARTILWYAEQQQALPR